MFSYSSGANPPIDHPRLLIGDTVDSGHIFEDEEIQAASTIATGTGTVSYLRTASILLDALAANRSRLRLTRLLDASLDPISSAQALRDQAKAYREIDDDALAVVIIRRCESIEELLIRRALMAPAGI